MAVKERKVLGTDQDWKEFLDFSLEQASDLSADYFFGRIKAKTFEQKLTEAFYEVFEKAAALGRTRAGYILRSDDLDNLMAGGFLRKNALQMVRGIDKAIGAEIFSFCEEAVHDLFRLSLGIANHTFCSLSPEGSKFTWVLGPEDTLCVDCVTKSREIVKVEYPFSVPGDIDTECQGKCRCCIVRADGVRGFRNA